MGVFTGPVASFPRSRLCDPDVLAAAETGVVEIMLGSGADALALLPMRTVALYEEVRHLTLTFLRALVALREPDPSRVLVDGVAWVAAWSPDEREEFLYGFAEAVAESLRLNDPAPAQFYVDVWSSREVEFRSPQFTGEVSEDTADALAAHVGMRR